MEGARNLPLVEDGPEPQDGPRVDVRDFWYVVAESRELTRTAPLARSVLDEWLVVFRDENGHAVVMQDRCAHRHGRLSRGTVNAGCVQCPYHGWTYEKGGMVVAVPAEGPAYQKVESRRVKSYAAVEQDGYIYVRLAEKPGLEVTPFSMPHHQDKGYRTVRLQNRFNNTVTNCVENFIDIPHTVFVHPGIFRSSRQQRFEATVERKGGSVRVSYRKETNNLGWFSWFLNPGGREIQHIDSFHMPNVTSVEYVFGPRRHFFITSQSVPVNDRQTLVYTDLTYNYGIWNSVAAPLVRWQGQAIIDQDLEALASQTEVVEKYGEKFANTQADSIHLFVESIRNAIARGRDPRTLPDRSLEIVFYV